MDSGQLCAAWASAIAGLNEDDLSVFEVLLAPECVFSPAGTSCDEIIATFKHQRANGWRRHEILSIVAGGPLLASTARNVSADGTTAHVAGVIRFNDNGQIIYMSSIEENPPAPAAT